MTRDGWLVLGLTLLMAGTAGAAPFDPDAATRAYLATVNGAARARSDAYFEGGYWLILWGALVTIGVNGALLASGVAGRLSAWAGRQRRSLAGRTLVFAVPFLLLSAVLTLPYSLWTDFYREAQYGLNNQTLGHWFGDWGKGVLVSLVLIPALLVPILLLVRRAPRTWWMWGTGVVVLAMIFGAAIAPVAIEPLFNRYTPLTQEPLRGELLGLARANGVPAGQVLVVDASRQTKKISANVAGLGSTARVAMNDNLLATRDDPMIRSVMGHEMGHYLLGHVWTLVGGLALIVLVGFLVLQWAVPVLVRRHGARWGVPAVHDPAVVPLAAIVFAVYGLLATPLQNTLVRNTEAQADIFGAERRARARRVRARRAHFIAISQAGAGRDRGGAVLRSPVGPGADPDGDALEGRTSRPGGRALTPFGVGGCLARGRGRGLRGRDAQGGKRFSRTVRRRDRARGAHSRRRDEHEQEDKAQARQADTYAFHRPSRMTTSLGRPVTAPGRSHIPAPGMCSKSKMLLANTDAVCPARNGARARTKAGGPEGPPAKSIGQGCD